MADQFARLAEVLGKRTPGSWSKDFIYTALRICRKTGPDADEIGGDALDKIWPAEDNASAICAAMSTVDALMEVAKASKDFTNVPHDVKRSAGGWAMEYRMLMALAKLDIAIEEALK